MNIEYRTEKTNELIDTLHMMLDLIENGDIIEDYDENLVACREAICSIRDTVHMELSKIQAKHFSAIQNDGVEI